MLRWPAAQEVRAAAEAWARQLARRHPEVRRAGYFGSYARGDAGVGSDLDLVLLVSAADEPWARRALAYDTLDLPVPAELVVYTEDEWHRLIENRHAFVRRIAAEVQWLAMQP